MTDKWGTTIKPNDLVLVTSSLWDPDVKEVWRWKDFPKYLRTSEVLTFEIVRDKLEN